MKHVMLVCLLAFAAFVPACDPQSGIASRSVEKYVTTPTPQATAAPEAPIDPAEIVTADVTNEGPKITVKRITDNKALNCDKYNRVAINVNDQSFVIRGVCSELMINGDRNRVTLVATSTIVLNGNANTVEYSKFANGKRPFVKDNGGANTIEKVAAPISAAK